MIAVVKIAGKQHLVKVGKNLKIDAKVDGKDKSIVFDQILFIGDEKKVRIGDPLVKGVVIEAEIVSAGKGKKVLVVKHHPKKRYRRVKGHRQDQTKVIIKKIDEK
jgi:large subunit ribosomal protein L21